MFHEVVSC